MASILEIKPSNFEAIAEQVWQYAMTKEYNSIIPIPIEKSVIDS
jgi:hypothetical protein